ncbi:hypothetical protein JTB14_002560 [Gonioctena quinquepunctata]|nr:hypothetical protein JTB14_002560 [Gonioctena quinquepunctata]
MEEQGDLWTLPIMKCTLLDIPAILRFNKTPRRFQIRGLCWCRSTLSIHTTMHQAEVFAVLAYARIFTKAIAVRKYLYVGSDSQEVLVQPDIYENAKTKTTIWPERSNMFCDRTRIDSRGLLIMSISTMRKILMNKFDDK